MKNPFIKEDSNAGLLTGLIIGAITAGGLAYLYYAKKKELAEAAAYAKEHATDYLKDKVHRIKKHKTDLHDLQSIISR